MSSINYSSHRKCLRQFSIIYPDKNDSVQIVMFSRSEDYSHCNVARQLWISDPRCTNRDRSDGWPRWLRVCAGKSYLASMFIFYTTVSHTIDHNNKTISMHVNSHNVNLTVVCQIIWLKYICQTHIYAFWHYRIFFSMLWKNTVVINTFF